jgi:UDP-glucuronate 4-epimerase
MRILVTGSSGFIGFHLINELTKNNIVLGIDSNNHYYSQNLKKID